MDGFELYHRLRRDRRYCAVPFVIASYTATFTDLSDENFAKAVGADCYLIKPFDPQKIVQRLEQVAADVQAAPPRLPESDKTQAIFFEEHRRRISVKLETKVAELSAANTALASSESEIRQLHHQLVDTIRRLEVEVEERRRAANQLQLGLSVAAMGSFGFDFDRGTSWWTPEALELLHVSNSKNFLAWEDLAPLLPPDTRASAVFAPEPTDFLICAKSNSVSKKRMAPGVSSTPAVNAPIRTNLAKIGALVRCATSQVDAKPRRIE